MATVEKIHEFSLPETIRAVKIMNFPGLKCFLIFTALFFVFLKVIQVYPQEIQQSLVFAFYAFSKTGKKSKKR